MAQVDVIDALAHYDVEHEAVKDPSDEGVGVETVFVVLDVTETDEIQLLQTSAACCVDRKKDGPCHETADKADGDGDLQVSEEEEAIKRVVIEDIAVWDFVESANPVEQAIGEIWRPLL